MKLSDLEHDLIFELMFGRSIDFEGKVGQSLLFKQPDLDIGVAMSIDPNFIIHLTTYTLDMALFSRMDHSRLADIAKIGKTCVAVQTNPAYEYNKKCDITSSIVECAFDKLKHSDK